MNYGVNSERIEKNMDDLFSSIIEEQQTINKVAPPNPDRTPLLAESLAEYQEVRGKGFFYNYMSSGRGYGPFTELLDGSVKYDLINAIGVNLLGHSHPLYVKAHLESAASDAIMCGNLLSYQEPYQATKKLIESVKGSKLTNFWFAGSGSFANDTALKLLWQKKSPNYKLIAFEKAFAGRSVATMNITANEAYKQDMPSSIEIDRVTHYDCNDPQGSTEKTINALNSLWEKNPDQYCAIMIELIQGEGGFIYGPEGYYKAIFDWAKEKGIYIWVDEVQTFGRTRELFAFQMFNLQEYVDILTIGKALQACGTFYSDELNPKPGLIAGTFNGSLVGLNMAIKTLDYLQQGDFYGEDGRIHYLENKFLNKLNQLKEGSCQGRITYSGGVGTMIAFEIGDSSKEITTTFLKKLFENGVIAFMAGSNPTRIRFLLPLVLTDEHIEEIFTIVEKTVLEVV
jgi:4-aminobutyrate aminotransferase-like enzyme